jgi:hypothetical protein
MDIKLMCLGNEVSSAMAKAAAFAPAMRPNTTKSHTALPPMRLPPCTPPVVSPAANRPGMTAPSVLMTSVSGSILMPPMV